MFSFTGASKVNKSARKQPQTSLDTSWSDKPLTATDQTALRVVSVFVGLSNVSAGLTTPDIHAKWYPEQDEKTFLKTFARDRETLETCGIKLSFTNGQPHQRWFIDKASTYATETALNARQALCLSVACEPLSHDPSFAYQRDLLLALVKLNNSFSTYPLTRDTTATQSKKEAQGVRSINSSGAISSAHGREILQKLLMALDGSYGVRVSYTKSNGELVTRDLALFGQFGFYDRIYFVAVPLNEAMQDSSSPQNTTTNQPHVYLLDRFVKVETLPHKHYAIPVDFNAEDYKKLPFQMGETCYTACLESLKDASKRRVEVADELRCARWCVSEGWIPRAPQSLVEAYTCLVRTAAAIQPQPPAVLDQHLSKSLGGLPQETMLHDAPKVTAAAASRGAGRKSALPQIRDLLALVSSLQDDNVILEIPTIAARLNCSQQQAQHLLQLMCQIGDEEGMHHLPLAFEDDFMGLTCINKASEPLRLNSQETRALLCALTYFGITVSNPLYKTLLANLAALSLTEPQNQSKAKGAHAAASRFTAAPHKEDAANSVGTSSLGTTSLGATSLGTTSVGTNSLGTTASSQLAGDIITCSFAIVESRMLAFDYVSTKVTTSYLTATQEMNRNAAPKAGTTSAEHEPPAKRHLVPLELIHSLGQWYVRGYDADRGAARMFCVANMTNLEVEAPVLLTQEQKDEVFADAAQPQQLIKATTTLTKELDAFAWPNTISLTVLPHTFAPLSSNSSNDSSNSSSTPAQEVLITAPYYGGNWLIRRFCAFADGLTLYDKSFAQAMQTYSLRLLQALISS